MLTSSTMRRDRGACNMKYKYNNYLTTSRPSAFHQVSRRKQALHLFLVFIKITLIKSFNWWCHDFANEITEGSFLKQWHFIRCLLCMWISSDTPKKTDAVCGPGSGRFISENEIILAVQVYLPSAMFVIVSWVSFLVKPEVVPGR